MPLQKGRADEHTVQSRTQRERGREGGREGGRKGGREGGREEGRERGREEDRELRFGAGHYKGRQEILTNILKKPPRGMSVC